MSEINPLSYHGSELAKREAERLAPALKGALWNWREEILDYWYTVVDTGDLLTQRRLQYERSNQYEAVMDAFLRSSSEPISVYQAEFIGRMVSTVFDEGWKAALRRLALLTGLDDELADDFLLDGAPLDLAAFLVKCAVPPEVVTDERHAESRLE